MSSGSDRRLIESPHTHGRVLHTPASRLFRCTPAPNTHHRNGMRNYYWFGGRYPKCTFSAVLSFVRHPINAYLAVLYSVLHPVGVRNAKGFKIVLSEKEGHAQYAAVLCGVDRRCRSFILLNASLCGIYGTHLDVELQLNVSGVTPRRSFQQRRIRAHACQHLRPAAFSIHYSPSPSTRARASSKLSPGCFFRELSLRQFSRLILIVVA